MGHDDILRSELNLPYLRKSYPDYCVGSLLQRTQQFLCGHLSIYVESWLIPWFLPPDTTFYSLGV